jgi:hypothetical protein
MPPSYLKTEDLNRYYQLANEMATLVSDGLSPTEALKQISQENLLDKPSIELLARTYNVSRAIKHYSESPEYLKTASFDIANPIEVINSLYPNAKNKKETKHEPKFVINVNSVKKESSGENNEEEEIKYWLTPDWIKRKPTQKDLVNKQLKNLTLLKEAQDKLDQYLLENKLKIDECADKLISWVRGNPWAKNQIICECDFRFDKPVTLYVNKVLSGIPKSAQYLDNKLFVDCEKPPFNYICKISECFYNIEKGLSLGKTIDKLLKNLDNGLSDVGQKKSIHKVAGTDRLGIKIPVPPKKESEKRSVEKKIEAVSPKKTSIEIEKENRELSREISPNFKDLEVAAKNLELMSLVDNLVLQPKFASFPPAEVYNGALTVAKLVPGITKYPLLFQSALLEHLNGSLTIAGLRDIQIALKNLKDTETPGKGRESDEGYLYEYS